MSQRESVARPAKPRISAIRWLGRGLFGLGIVLMVWMWGPWTPRQRPKPEQRPPHLEQARAIDWTQERWARFNHADQGLSFDYPARWSITPLFDARTATPVGDLELRILAMSQFQPPRATLFVQRYQSPRNLSPQEWLRRAEQDAVLRARLTGDLLDRRPALVTGLPAVRLVSEAVPSGDAQIWEAHTLFFGSGALAYQITISAPKSASRTFAAAIDRILGSVTWDPAVQPRLPNSGPVGTG